MNNLQVIDNAIVIKEVFGSFKILDEIDTLDIPEVIQFARIAYNYKMMSEKIEELKSDDKRN